MAGQLTVSGISPNEPGGSRTFGPLTISGTQPVVETLGVPLASGDNTFNVPTGAVAVWIIPPVGNAIVVKLRSSLNSGDAGLPLAPATATGPYPFPVTPPTTIILNAASAITALYEIIFI